MLASPILSQASSTQSLPSRLPSSRRAMVIQPEVSVRERLGPLHVFMSFLMSIIGAGMLSVPYTLVLVPTWQALAGIAFVAVGMATTANALLHAHVHAAARAEFEDHSLGAGSKFVGFQKLAIRAGGPALGYAVSIVAASGVYGGCVGNIQIIRDLTPFVVELVYSKVTEMSKNAQDHVKQIVMWALLAVVLLPLCMFQRLSALQPTNYVSFGLALYLVGAVVAKGYNPEDASSSSGSSTGGTESLNGNGFTRLAQSISIYNFAFMMTLNLLPLFTQLFTVNGGDAMSRRGASMRSRRSSLATAAPLLTARSQMTSCIFCGSFVSALLYSTIGYAAYNLYGDTIDGNILLNLQSDPVMKVPLLAMYVTVLFTFPLLFLPLRSLIEEMLGHDLHKEQLSPVVDSYDTECGQFQDELEGGRDRLCLSVDRGISRLIVVVTLLCSQQLIALNVPGIEVVFSLLGATSCLMICYVFPVIAFTALYPWRRVRRGVIWLALLWTIVAVVSVQGVTCVWLLLT